MRLALSPLALSPLALSLLALSLVSASGCGGGGDDPDASGLPDTAAASDGARADAPAGADAATCVPPAAGAAVSSLIVESSNDLIVASGLACIRLVNFDDVDTSGEAEASFEADRYARLGIVISGADGQYADETFGYPLDFIATSPSNSYAPGPPVADDSTAGAGANTTTITFEVDGVPAQVAAFGAEFIDADNALQATTRIEAFDAADASLGFDEPFTASGAAAFRGLVSIDGDGAPVSAIAKIVLTNGQGWPHVAENEGVTMDDFTFAPPVVP